MFLSHPALKAKMYEALARDIVRYVGEPVAVVVARDRYLAEDAVRRIVVEYDPPRHRLPRQRPGAGRPLVYDDAPGNVAAHFEQTVGDIEHACATADYVHEPALRMQRGCGHPIETRCAVAQLDPFTETLTLWVTIQAPHRVRRALANLLDLPQQRLRVIAPDVGGGWSQGASTWSTCSWRCWRCACSVRQSIPRTAWNIF